MDTIDSEHNMRRKLYEQAKILKEFVELAKNSLDARDKEAKALMVLENACENFSSCGGEIKSYEDAMVEASKADAELRKAIKLLYPY